MNPVDSQFNGAVLAIYFDFEGGKLDGEASHQKLVLKLKEAEDSQHLAHQGKALEYLGVIAYHQNKFDEAHDSFEKARRAYTRGGYHRLVGMLENLF